MAGYFYLMIGTLSIRMLSATRKKKSNWLKQKGKFKGKHHGPQAWFCLCLSAHSDLSVRVLPSSVGFPLHCRKMVSGKQNQKKVVCSGVSILRKKEICAHSPSVGSSFCLIVRNGSRVHSCSMANERTASPLLAFSTKIPNSFASN